jgi:uncharacterized protein (DUF111 family)
VQVRSEIIRLKVVTLPDGTRRAKPEFDDVSRAAKAQGRSLAEVSAEALAALGSP